MTDRRTSRPFRFRSWTLTMLVVPIAAAAAGAPAAAQEFGVYHARASSDLAELHAPAGMGAFMRVFPTEHTSLRLSFQRQTTSSDRVDQVCTVYIPPVDCGAEGVATSTRFQTVALTAGLRFRPRPFMELEAGVGPSMNRIHSRDRTESGRQSSLFIKQTAQFGILVQGGARFRPLPVPIVIEAGAAAHRVRLNGCAEEQYHDRYAPFCGNATLREFRVGLAYDARW